MRLSESFICFFVRNYRLCYCSDLSGADSGKFLYIEVVDFVKIG